jgi:retron-type reverse transcriptase
MSGAKAFAIPKQSVWAAWLKVKANQGAHGVDGESIEAFEAQLGGNLYKLWNRMSSGSYLPAPVRAVEIPKGNGKMRLLGIPTVADRIAQTVVRDYLKDQVAPMFHMDSYA